MDSNGQIKTSWINSYIIFSRLKKVLFKLATLSPDLPRILILQWNFSKMFLRSTAQLNKLESITKTSDENLEAIVAIKRETP